MKQKIPDGFFLSTNLPVQQSSISVSDTQLAFARIKEHYADCLPAVDTADLLGYSFSTWRFILVVDKSQLLLLIQFVSDETDLEFRRIVFGYLLTDPRASSLPLDQPENPRLVNLTPSGQNGEVNNLVSNRAAKGHFPKQEKNKQWLERNLLIGYLKKYQLLLITVVLPTLISVIYYGLIVSDIYISESKFILRVPQRSNPSALGALFQGMSFSKTSEDTSVVHEYVKSRDALNSLIKKVSLRDAFGSRHVDMFSRFPGMFDEDSFEHLHRYFQKHVSVDSGSSTAVSTLRVQAFTANDAFLINKTLLEMAEGLVNELNDRSRQDILRYALAEVALAEEKVKVASNALSEFRGKSNVFDPEKQSNIQLQQVAKLQDELLARKALLSQLKFISPQNPQIPSVATAINELELAIENEKGKVTGQKNSLSNRSVDYERLVLERAFSEKLLGSTLISLEQARDDAQRKQIYLERVALPSQPDVAMEPKRIRNILACFVLGLVAWGIFSMLLAGIKEHQD